MDMFKVIYSFIELWQDACRDHPLLALIFWLLFFCFSIIKFSD